jgi:radical SAM protein with 4Fe4S-binding SPASM domain
MVDFSDLRDEVKMILQPEVDLGDPIGKKRCDHRRTIFHPSGKVYSCDQYINDERTALGDIRTDSLESILNKKDQLWEAIKRHVRKTGKEMACDSCEFGRRHMGGCLSCMKYCAHLLAARAEGRPDDEWFETTIDSPLHAVAGETYYCDGLRLFRNHVKAAIKNEMTGV